MPHMTCFTICKLNLIIGYNKSLLTSRRPSIIAPNSAVRSIATAELLSPSNCPAFYILNLDHNFSNHSSG